MEPSCILAIAYYPHPRKYATFASLGLGKRQCRVKCWELIAHVHSYSQVSCGHAIAQLMVIHLREIEGYHGWMNGRENLNEINAPKLRAALGWQPKKVVRSFGLGVLSHELVFLLMILIIHRNIMDHVLPLYPAFGKAESTVCGREGSAYRYHKFAGLAVKTSSAKPVTNVGILYIETAAPMPGHKYLGEDSTKSMLVDSRFLSRSRLDSIMHGVVSTNKLCNTLL